ncbi:MAG: hypothetical protein C0471_11085 [Erythrobacter sp.]|nr:hypothetical protein [Erythrobacter sp.]
MGAENIFRKVFGRKAVSTPNAPAYNAPPQAASTQAPEGALHPALLDELQRLELYARGFGRRAIRYVTTGEDAALLADMAPLAHRNLAHATPYQQARPVIYDVIRATNAAVVTGAIAPGPQLLRLIEIRIAALQVRGTYGQQLDARQLAALGMGTILWGGLESLKVNYKIDWTKAIPLETAFAHYRAIGGTMADLFELLLRRDESTYLAQSEGSWSASATCGDYLRAYPAALATAMVAVDPAKRPNGIKLIEHHKVTDVPEIAALLVAMLTKPFNKTDRASAISAIARLNPDHLLALLQHCLPNGDIDTRHSLVDAAARAATPEIIALLKERAKVEKAAKVQAAIAAVLEVETASAPAGVDGTGDAEGYLAITGAVVAPPPRCDLGSDAIPDPSDAVCIEFVALVEQLEERRRQSFIDYNTRYAGTARQPATPPVPYTKAEIEAAFATLTAAAMLPEGLAKQLVSVVRHHPEGQAWLRDVLEPVSVAGRLRILKATGFDDIRSVLGLNYAYRSDELFGVDLLREWLAAGTLDLRDIADAENLRHLLTFNAPRYGGDRALDALNALPSDAVWPWMADNLEVFDEAFGLRPAAMPKPLDRALTMLAFLPTVPQRYFPRLLEIAVSEKRRLRLQAMALLRDAKDLPARIAAMLDDKRQPVRINAASWLADIRSTTSEKALRARLKKEKSDPVRTALIVALERLGADLSDVIGPASLIADAKAAAAKTPLKLPEWLVKMSIPSARFRDGTTVPKEVVEHWLALAIRLKEPGAHGQFGIYLDQLEPDDARALSGWALESWIAYDTATATLDEATAFASAFIQGRYFMHAGQHLHASKLSPQQQAQVIAEMAREKMGEMLNSGSDTKGLLALACRADPVWAAERVRWFLKKHGRRSNQAMALLEALAGTGAPAALQVVIAASTRLKQKSTQARAAEIAQRYADDRGWSVDELADRTVPAAGFDDDGELELPCGEDAKPYVARLDAALAIHLFNPDGKVVKALPAGDDDNTRESKKAFTAAKKELAQVIELQATRLFEAMCVERQWPVADWRLAFHQHPVMRRLIERLVWQGLDAEGQPLGLFRPTQEGDFTDAADNDVAIDTFAAVRLAHGALVDAETCAAWTQHLKDYEVKPFLAQFDNLRAPLTPELGEAEAITDRQGWAADSRTFRGAAEKRGYQRVMRDSGGCHEYVKEFPSHGITATIWHSGCYAVDENVPQALTELKFTKAGHRGVYRLKDVPPVLLAECWADYQAVAARGAFDPAWEKISPW